MNLLNYADLAEPILLYSGLIWREVVQKTFNSGPWMFFLNKKSQFWVRRSIRFLDPPPINFVHDLDSLDYNYFQQKIFILY